MRPPIIQPITYTVVTCLIVQGVTNPVPAVVGRVASMSKTSQVEMY